MGYGDKIKTALGLGKPNEVSQLGSFKSTHLDKITNEMRLRYFYDSSAHYSGHRKLIYLVKRVIRKLLKFIIHPIIDDQSKNNMILRNKINDLCILVGKLSDELHKAKVEIDELKKNRSND